MQGVSGGENLTELQALFSAVASELSLSDVQRGSVLMKMNDAEVTVVALSDGSVDHVALGRYGIEKWEDAQTILMGAKSFLENQERLNAGSVRKPLLETRQHSDSFDGLTGSETPDIQSLSRLLSKVYNWESLGIQLGLQMHQLEKIRQECQGDLEMCKNRVFDTWLRQNVNPSWKDIVEALKQMEENYLADRIRRLFWQCFPEGSERQQSPLRQISVGMSDSPSFSKKSVSIDSCPDSEPGSRVVLVPVHIVTTTTSATPTQMSPFIGSHATTLSASTQPPTTSLLSHVPISSYQQPSVTLLPSATTASPQTKNSDMLVDLLRSMTLEDPQEIEITCKVYDADTDRLIESTGAPLTRDIKVKPRRVLEFSSNAVPIGTNIRLEVSTNSRCYLYIINKGTSGKVSLLLPNEYDTTNHFNPYQTYYLPGIDSGFEIEGPPGKETIQILAYSEKQMTLENLVNRPVQDDELYRDISIKRKKQSAAIKKGFAQVQFHVK